MRRFSLKNIFNTSMRSERYVKDRHISTGIKNHSLYTTKMNTSLRCDRLQDRTIPNMPFKILDAPGIVDDFYLNILDWSTQNIIHIGLDQTLYQYNYTTSKVSEVLQNEEGNMITGISSKDRLVAIGCNNGTVKILEDNVHLFDIKVSESRVCTLSFNDNILSCGTKQGDVVCYDMRDYRNVCKRYSFHDGEICSLKWNYDKKYLASGGNDNLVIVYDIRSGTPKNKFNAHKGAVKAMNWCPWKYAELVTGGGTKDKTIKTWDISEGKLVNSTNVDSQVCTLNHVSKYKEIISSHGFSKNNIVCWKASSMKEISSFGKHEGRVLYTALKEDGSVLASVSSDEDLKFWKIYEDKSVRKRSSMSFR